MVKKLIFVVATSALFCGLSLSDFTSTPLEAKTQDIIIEFKDIYGESEESRELVQKQFMNDFSSEFGYNYTRNGGITGLSNMLFLEVPTSALDLITSSPYVSEVYYNNYYDTTELSEEETVQYYFGFSEEGEVLAYNPDSGTAPDRNYSRNEMNAPGVTVEDAEYSTYNQGDGTVVAILDNSFTLNHPALKTLGNDVEQRFDSAYIDSVKASYPSQVPGLYYNNKVVYYYDYAGNDTKVDTVSLNHGHHVSGIAVGNNENPTFANSEDGGFIGIAPNAQVALMKVFPDNEGGAADTTIVTALNTCYYLDVDVVNMSLGSPIWEFRSERDEEIEGSGSGAFALIRRMVEKGIQLSISAGNEGRANFMQDGYSYGSSNANYGLYGEGMSVDNVDGGILGSYATSHYATIVASGRNSQDDTTATNSRTPSYVKKVSNFSSDGPTYDMHISPDVITPGTAIWSASNPRLGEYYVYMNGTSMAAPNYTGAVSNILSNLDWAEMSDGEEREAARSEARLDLKARIQSTASPYTQTHANSSINGHYYSVRKQGAGLANIKNAIATDVYFKGVDNTRGLNEVNNYSAEVELGNDEKISKGIIDFDLQTINTSSVTKQYNATLYVEASLVASDIENDSGNYASLFDTTIDTHDFGTQSILPGENSLSFNYEIDEEAKEYLEQFPEGTYLEGYLIFTPVDDSDVPLSVPFLGFYGDYASARPVEEFDFARTDTSDLVGSDLLTAAYQARNKPNANFVSTIVTSDSMFTTDMINNIASGDVNPKRTYNEAVISEDGDLVVAIDELSNYILIQQVVYRTCTNNRVELVNSEGNVVYTTSLSGVDDGGTYSSSNGHLWKSMILTNKDFDAPKAYGTLAFRDDAGHLLYPEGKYTLRFTYNLLYGHYQVSYEYGLEIRDEVATRPSYQGSNTNYQNDLATTYTLRVDDNVTRVVADSTLAPAPQVCEILVDAVGKYVTIDLASFRNDGRFVVTMTNEYGLVTYHQVNIDDLGYGYFLEGTSATIFNYTNRYVYETTESEVDENNKVTRNIRLRVNNAQGNTVQINSGVTLGIELPAWAVAPDATTPFADVFTVKEYNLFGEETSTLSWTYSNGALLINTTTGILDVTFTRDPNYVEPSPDDPEVPVEPDTPETPTESNNGLIIGLSVGGGVVGLGAIIGLVIFFIKKH